MSLYECVLQFDLRCTVHNTQSLVHDKTEQTHVSITMVHQADWLHRKLITRLLECQKVVFAGFSSLYDKFHYTRHTLDALSVLSPFNHRQDNLNLMYLQIKCPSNLAKA